MDFYANLHMHSTHSDGVYSPAELVSIAKAEGYKALAITDHDVATAYPELKKACEAGGMALVAHPHEQLQYLDTLMEMGLEGSEAWHPDLLPEEKVLAHQLALEKGLYISGGSDRSGLCGGQYQFFDRPEECEFYLPPRSVGTTYEYYMEIKNRKLNR